MAQRNGKPGPAGGRGSRPAQGGVRSPRPGRFRLPRFLAVLGPGVIAAAAGNDAGGIVTYAQAGAQWRYDFVWLMVVITVCMVIVQEMCARMGAVTGKGLADLIREKFGVGWTLFAILTVLVSNGGTVVSEFAGIAAALGIFGVSRFLAIPVMAVILWWLILSGTRAKVERFFMLLSIIFVVYIPAMFLTRPNWGEVARAAAHPVFHLHTEGYILAVVALIGTTITPYMQIMQQSEVAQSSVRVEDYARTAKIDTIVGCTAADFISICIIITTAVALFHGFGNAQINTAADAARGLKVALAHISGPHAGMEANILFAAGLFGASMLAGAVLPLTTAYFICEAIGWPLGTDNRFRDAPQFYFLFTGILLIGAVVALIPTVDPTRLLYLVQAVEGCLLPILLVFIMLIINDREVMPQLRNGPVFNVLAWLTTVAVGAIALIFVFLQYVQPLFNHAGG